MVMDSQQPKAAQLSYFVVILKCHKVQKSIMAKNFGNKILKTMMIIFCERKCDLRKLKKKRDFCVKNGGKMDKSNFSGQTFLVRIELECSKRILN